VADLREAIAMASGGAIQQQVSVQVSAPAPRRRRRKSRKKTSYAARTRKSNAKKTAKRQSQISAMTKAQLVAQVRRVKPSAGSQTVLMRKTKPALKQMLRRAHSQSLPSQRKPRKSSPKLSKAKTARAAKIARAIRSGKISAKQGIVSYRDYSSGTNRQKLDRYIALYKGTAIRKKSAAAKSKSLKSLYAQIQGPKKPYALTRGYTVQVGGGARGPGVVRKLTKQAKPFSQLSHAEQQAVVSFLNSQKGSKLRGKGAPKSFSLTSYRQLKASKKSAKRQRRGAANWW